jgi:nucleotidyltransferase substrate binding protein (TIGR01987 family)
MEQGFTDLNSPRSVLRQAIACGLITGSEDWTALMEDRSSTSHVYDEGLAVEIAGRIRDRHVKLFAELLEKMAG